MRIFVYQRKFSIMEVFVKRKIALLLLLFCSFAINVSAGAFNEYNEYNHYNPKDHEVDPRTPWPTTLTFSETKTNYMLGEALLKRIYKRADSMENIIRNEMQQMYEKLKSEIQKNFRKCDRQRRRAENLKMHNGTVPEKHQNGNNKRDKRKRKKERKPTHEYGYDSELQMGYNNS